MTTVAVIGATGTVGSSVVSRLRDRAVGVVEIARAYAVDVVTGNCLSEALRGVDVVIDVSNPMPTDDYPEFSDTLITAARNVVGACTSHGIHRLWC
jgi:nucleoside-diphosphate-sugar epimerase